MTPRIIKGGKFNDIRGELKFNNDFDASEVKRLYFISNSNEFPIRGWQGHKIEQRWFTVVQGSMMIDLKKVVKWSEPPKFSKKYSFLLSSENMDVLLVPPGYVSKISSLTEDAKLLAMSDHLINEIDDEYRFDAMDNR